MSYQKGEYEKKKEGNNQCQCGSWQCICQWHIWLFTQGINETPFYIQVLVGTSHFQNYSYYLVRLLQISILDVKVPRTITYNEKLVAETYASQIENDFMKLLCYKNKLIVFARRNKNAHYIKISLYINLK